MGGAPNPVIQDGSQCGLDTRAGRCPRDMILIVEAVWVDPSQCPSCGGVAGAEYIVLHVYDDIDLPTVLGGPCVEIIVSCIRCHHRRALLQTYRLRLQRSFVEQLRMLEEVLAAETGLPIFIDPPEDPPAGVREPRRPAPSTGSVGVRLTPPE